MAQEEFSSDELEIIQGWRLVKQHKRGHIHVILQSQGNEFYIEMTPGKYGRVFPNKISQNANEKNKA